MTDSTAIVTDASTDDSFDDSEDAGVAEFLKNLTGAEKPPSKGDEGTTETEEEGHSEEAEEHTEEGEEEAAEGDEKKDEKAAAELSDDTKLKVKVAGEEVEVSIGDLKRLAGQERALNAKSMEVAEARKAYEANSQKAEAIVSLALQKAQERFKPYSELDYIDLRATMDKASWDVLRADALKAQSDVRDLEAALADHSKASAETSSRELAKAAKAAVEVLQGPPEKGGIEGWSQGLYNDLMAYAISQGVPQETAYRVVDPAALRVMHKAMMFDKGKVAATAQIAKVKVQAAKVAKPSSNGSPSGTGSRSEAMARLSKTGSDDDAVSAFMSSMRR